MTTLKASLTIQLSDPPQPYYYPGATISGQVSLVASRSEGISAITITLSGRCKVKIRKHDHYTTRTYRSRGYYFLQTRTLYEGHGYTHKAGMYSWPFTLSIPYQATLHCEMSMAASQPKHQLNKVGILERTEMAGPVNDYFTPQLPWRGSNDLRPHILPGSFTFSYSGQQSETDAKVEYVLLAKLVRPPSSILFPTKDLEISQDIPFGVFAEKRVDSTPPEPRFEQRCEKCIIKFPAAPLISSLVPASTKYSFRDTVRSVMNMSSNLMISVPIRIVRPTVVISGVEPLIYIEIPAVACPPGGTWSSNPSPIIRLRSLTIYVIVTTAMRDNGTTAIAQSVTAREKHVITEQKTLNVDVINLGEEGAQGFMYLSPAVASVRDFTFDMARFPPTFSTYNISRDYKLGVELKFHCMGQNAELVKEVDIEVVPWGRPTSLGGLSVDEPPTFEQTSREEKLKDEKGRPAPQEPDKAKDEEQLPAYQP